MQDPSEVLLETLGNKLASALDFQLPGLWEHRRLLCKPHRWQDGLLLCRPRQTHTGYTKCPQESCAEGHVYRGEGVLGWGSVHL